MIAFSHHLEIDADPWRLRLASPLTLIWLSQGVKCMLYFPEWPFFLFFFCILKKLTLQYCLIKIFAKLTLSESARKLETLYDALLVWAGDSLQWNMHTEACLVASSHWKGAFTRKGKGVQSYKDLIHNKDRAWGSVMCPPPLVLCPGNVPIRLHPCHSFADRHA